MQKNDFVIKTCVLADIKLKKRRYYLPRCIIRQPKITVVFSFKQFMMMLLCILHFCILGQTEKNGYLIFCLQMDRIMCEKNNQ